MAVRLRPFPAGSAGVVSGWARTREEVMMWCGHPAAPVPAGQISAWAREDGVQPFGLYRDEQLVAYGELWTDDGEAEVELARHPRVFLRVHPDNTAARRCYAGTAFEPAAPHLAALWNASQPVEYVWLTLAPQPHPEPSTSSEPPPGNAATGLEGRHLSATRTRTWRGPRRWRSR